MPSTAQVTQKVLEENTQAARTLGRAQMIKTEEEREVAGLSKLPQLDMVPTGCSVKRGTLAPVCQAAQDP